MSNKNLLWTFVGMIVFLFGFYFGIVINRHYKIMHHKREILLNVDKFLKNPIVTSKSDKDFYFSTNRDITAQLGNRDTTLTCYIGSDGKIDGYCGIFWDYRDTYYQQASFLEKFYWDDFDVYGYLIIPDTTTREYKLDKQIILSIRKKLESLKIQ